MPLLALGEDRAAELEEERDVAVVERVEELRRRPPRSRTSTGAGTRSRSRPGRPARSPRRASRASSGACRPSAPAPRTARAGAPPRPRRVVPPLRTRSGPGPSARSTWMRAPAASPIPQPDHQRGRDRVRLGPGAERPRSAGRSRCTSAAGGRLRSVDASKKASISRAASSPPSKPFQVPSDHARPAGSRRRSGRGNGAAPPSRGRWTRSAWTSGSIPAERSGWPPRARPRSSSGRSDSVAPAGTRVEGDRMVLGRGGASDWRKKKAIADRDLERAPTARRSGGRRGRRIDVLGDGPVLATGGAVRREQEPAAATGAHQAAASRR